SPKRCWRRTRVRPAHSPPARRRPRKPKAERLQADKDFDMNSFIKGLAAIGIALGMSGAAQAAEEEGGTPHYPLIKPVELDWSFAGRCGTYDKGQLQRGLKVYRESCAACHGLERVAFRTLEELGYSEAQVSALAAEYEVEDGPDAAGDMFMRPAIPSDHFP